MDVYFDYEIPYAYLAWQRITKVHPGRYQGTEILWKPVSAGHIFAADGTAPNVTMPNQKRYLEADVRRWAQLYGAPFAPPPDGSAGAMPVRSIDAMRLHFVADQMGPSMEKAWMEAVFLAYFRDGQDISDRSVLDGLAKDVGLEADSTACDRESLKRLLVANTKEAYDAGAPGVPFVVLGDQAYWGNDRLWMVEERLGVVATPS